MFDIGGPEFLLLVILGLLIFGPRRLPEVGKQLGGFVAQMRNAMKDFQGTLEREVALDEIKDAAKDLGGLRKEAAGFARELSGIGAPAYADPSRRAPEGAVPSLPADAVTSSEALPVDALPPEVRAAMQAAEAAESAAAVPADDAAHVTNPKPAVPPEAGR